MKAPPKPPQSSWEPGKGRVAGPGGPKPRWSLKPLLSRIRITQHLPTSGVCQRGRRAPGHTWETEAWRACPGCGGVEQLGKTESAHFSLSWGEGGGGRFPGARMTGSPSPIGEDTEPRGGLHPALCRGSWGPSPVARGLLGVPGPRSRHPLPGQPRPRVTSQTKEARSPHLCPRLERELPRGGDVKRLRRGLGAGGRKPERAGQCPGGSVLPPDPSRQGRPCAHRKGRSPFGRSRGSLTGREQDILASFPSCAWEHVPGPAGPAGQWPHSHRAQPFKAGLVLPRPETQLGLARYDHPSRFAICLTKDRGATIFLCHCRRRFSEQHQGAGGHREPFSPSCSTQPQLPLRSQLEARSPRDTGQSGECLGPG